jgi:hypothetical protein
LVLSFAFQSSIAALALMLGEPAPGGDFVAVLRDHGLPVLVPDAWLNGPAIIAALGQRRAKGLLAASPGLPLQRIGAAARRFATDFRATQPGGSVSQEGLYTAQATEVLLNAIARSDGTRPSVSHALLSTRINHGLVGPVRFDAAGDVRPSPFALIRLSGRATTINGVDHDGSNIVEVLSPR